MRRQYHGVTFAAIDVAQLEALLLETIPAQLAVERERGRTDRRRGARADAVRRRGARITAAADGLALLDAEFETQLARELADPSNFGTGKQLVMRGIAAGYDMSTEEGVAEFVQAFAQSQREDVRPKPKKAKAKAAAKPKAATKARPKPKAAAKPKAATKARPKPKAAAKPKAAKASPKAKAPAKAKAKAPAKAKAAAKAKAKPRKRR